MPVIAQLAVNGIIAGSIYALVACGFSIVYSTNRFMHFAHGASVVSGAYILYWFFSMGIPLITASALTVLLCGFLGLLMYRLVYAPLQEKNASNVILLIAGIGMLILVENIILIISGSSVKRIGYVTITRGIDIFGVIMTPLQLLIFAVSLVLLVLLWLFIKKTCLGRNMRAVADNRELAGIVGINQKKIAGRSFFIGSCIAGMAGVLIGMEQNLETSMGTSLMIKGFTGAVAGGVSSVPASILGSYVLGLAENFGVWIIPSGYKDAIAFLLLIMFILFRPAGLFVVDKGVKE